MPTFGDRDKIRAEVEKRVENMKTDAATDAEPALRAALDDIRAMAERWGAGYRGVTTTGMIKSIADTARAALEGTGGMEPVRVRNVYFLRDEESAEHLRFGVAPVDGAVRWFRVYWPEALALGHCLTWNARSARGPAGDLLEDLRRERDALTLLLDSVESGGVQLKLEGA